MVHYKYSVPTYLLHDYNALPLLVHKDSSLFRIVRLFSMYLLMLPSIGFTIFLATADNLCDRVGDGLKSLVFSYKITP